MLLFMMCFFAACSSQKSGDLSMSETNSTENATESKSVDHIDGQQISEVWGDRIFEKCGIRRDEGGDDGKTLEIRGKRRLSARDGGANYQQS